MSLLSLALLLLILSLGLGLLRVFIGPSVEDRMLSVQLMGTSGVALLLLLGFLVDSPATIDVALVLALLAAVSVAALTRRESNMEKEDD
ncbi:MAG: monovalent cation/H+ antiporter complex subunit F [Gammaproteobacteria bacterium]|nr:monovalent cation/H+ antiporter complex subunit F [Gammaproteobacteria bacterium]